MALIRFTVVVTSLATAAPSLPGMELQMGRETESPVEESDSEERSVGFTVAHDGGWAPKQSASGRAAMRLTVDRVHFPRTSVAPTSASNGTWLARTKLHWFARSVR